MLYLYNNKKTAVYAVFSSIIYDSVTRVNYFGEAPVTVSVSYQVIERTQRRSST